MIEEPITNWASVLRVELSVCRLDPFEGFKEFDFLPFEGSVQATKPVQRL
jgi:hypothetical protein